jgi:hypothetical protein
MESLLPGYVAALRKLCQMPEEFEHRFWVSHVEALLYKVKSQYENYHFQAQKANLFGKMAETMVNLAWQATEQRPIPYSTPLQTCISISPLGKIEPALFGDPSRRQGNILLSMDRFERVAQNLNDEIMSGKVILESEDEIPKMMYDRALRSQGLPRQQN